MRPGPPLFFRRRLSDYDPLLSRRRRAATDVHTYARYVRARLPASRLKPCRAQSQLQPLCGPGPAPIITYAVLLRRAGILNTIGGAYCIKAKSAIAAMQANGPPAVGAPGATTAVLVAGSLVAAQAQAVLAQAAATKI